MKTKLTTLATTIVVATCFSQKPIVTQYTTSNSALPSNTIYSIANDINGNKWLGTDKGLVKFDGTTFAIYNKQNSGLFTDTVENVKVDKNNTVWFTSKKEKPGFGWEYNMNKLENNIYTKFDSTNSPLSKLLNKDFVIDTNGVVRCLDSSPFDGVTSPKFSILKSYQNNIWVLDTVPKNLMTDIQLEKPSNSVVVRNPYDVSSNHINDTLFKFNGSQWTKFTLNPNKDTTSVLGIITVVIDATGDYNITNWIGGDGDSTGFFVYKNNSLQFIQLPVSDWGTIASRKIQRDNNNKLWFTGTEPIITDATNYGTLNNLTSLVDAYPSNSFILEYLFEGKMVYAIGSGLMVFENPFSITASIANKHTDKIQVSSYPNPFSENLIVDAQLGQNETIDQVSVSNVLGEIVYSSNTIGNNTAFNLKLNDDLPNTLYYLTITTSIGNSTTKQIVKQ